MFRLLCGLCLVLGLLVGDIGIGAAADEDPVVARIDDVVIRQSELKKYIDEVRRQNKDALRTPQERKIYLEQIIEMKLLAQEARRVGLDKDSDVLQRMDIILARQYYNRLREGLNPPADELKAYYANNPQAFQAPEEVHVKHIIVGSREAAEKAMTELDTGRSFESVARETNMDDSKERGGDIGWYPRGRLVPEFETAAFALQKGEVSNIIPTRYGFHIIKLEDRRPSRLKPYEEVQEEVRRRVIEVTVERRHKEIVAKLRQGRNVQVYPEAIP
ncbi:MAG: peptidyl-prolyl cis-trans isomerase [Desulfobacterales bacterium]|jgi:peptidyl-prolyl cis-trans isomerase C